MAYDMQKRAKLRCMHLLEKKDYTEQELRRKLENGRTPYGEEEIEAALEYVRGFHYVDDSRYAENYIEAMKSRKSKRQIQQELFQKGVDREKIVEAFEEAGEIPEEDQIRAWMRKRKFDPKNADLKEKQRMYAFLARRGFGREEISRAMQLED